jgi:hypothetical protein
VELVVKKMASVVPDPGRWKPVKARKRKQSPGDSNRIPVRSGEARVWFYRNESTSSIDVYVRPADSGQNQKAASICFRISSRDFIGR